MHRVTAVMQAPPPPATRPPAFISFSTTAWMLFDILILQPAAAHTCTYAGPQAAALQVLYISLRRAYVAVAPGTARAT